MEIHPGQWLYEEGMAYWWGTNLIKIDTKRGGLMIDASASSGFPTAVAHCYLQGWNGLKQDQKKGFEMLVKIEKETNGYHWTQNMLGKCYHYGNGVGKDTKKSVEYYSLSAVQGNSAAMNSVGFCHGYGIQTNKNLTKAFEWYEKSANLGNCLAMCNVGMFYHNGKGVTTDVNKARKWYTKAVEQGYTPAQTSLDHLNAQISLDHLNAQ